MPTMPIRRIVGVPAPAPADYQPNELVAARVGAGFDLHMANSDATALVPLNVGAQVASDGWAYMQLAADFVVAVIAGELAAGLAFAAAANTGHEVELMGSFQTAATTTGAAAMLDIPNGTVAGMELLPSANNGTVQAAPQWASGAVISPLANVGIAAALYPVLGKWLVSVGATGGSIAPRWRTGVAASEARLMVGSIFKVRIAAGAEALAGEHGESVTFLSFDASDQAGYDAAVAANAANPLIVVVRYAEP